MCKLINYAFWAIFNMIVGVGFLDKSSDEFQIFHLNIIAGLVFACLYSYENKKFADKEKK